MAFETAGHIAHMNLRDETEKYKYVIGQVILDVLHKNNNIKLIFSLAFSFTILEKQKSKNCC